MTRRDLVWKAIRHESTDTVPFCIHFTKEAAEKLQAHFGTQDIDERIGNHIVGVSAPWWGWRDPPDDMRLSPPPSRLPRVCGAGSFEACAESAKRLRETTDRFILAYFYASLFEKAWFARGMENLLADMALHPDFCEALFEKIVQTDLVMLEMVLAVPEIDGVLLGCDWGSQVTLLMSPAHWRRYIGPRHARMFRLIREHGKAAFLHSCGMIEAVLPDVVEMGVQVLNPLQPECMDVRGIKERYGPHLAFWGGVSTQRTLPRGTHDDVRREIGEAIELLSRDGGYILAPAQSVQEDVPLDNILAFIQTARERAGMTPCPSGRA